MPSYRTDEGRVATLGRELGRGGEGAVFEVRESSDQVAKIYHAPIDSERESKLKAMIAVQATGFRKFAAWPTSFLVEGGSRIAGVLMPKVSGRPIHQLYSPAQRDRYFPNQTWEFLIRVAQNCATVVESIHEAGIVIGDVNQGNFLVRPDALVNVIDCDSFQVARNGTTHYCNVGVSHFQPPEFQNVSLRGITRTPNHDCFGLAVLIFHLLYMGRHPFAGKPLTAGDLDLETAIKQYRYAFAPDAQHRGIAPPPHSLSPRYFPSDVSDAFFRAFCESGVRSGRPTAREWRQTLERLENGLTTCKFNPGHVYPTTAGACPWCALVGTGAPEYFIIVRAKGTTVLRVDADLIAKTRGVIMRLSTDLNSPLSGASISQLFVATPLPPEVQQAKINAAVLYWVALVCAGLSVFGLYISVYVFLATLALSGILYAIRAITVAFSPLHEVRTLRQRHMEETRKEVTRLESIQSRARVQWAELGKKYSRDLFDAVELLERMPQTYAQRVGQLQAEAKTLQLQAHMKSHFIADAEIPGIGPKKTQMLEYNGIETAWDIERYAVLNVTGFGEANLNKLMRWRRMIEGQFSFNATAGVPEHLKQNAFRECLQEQQMYESHIRNVGIYVDQMYTELQRAVWNAGQELNQARLDAQQAALNFKETQ